MPFLRSATDRYRQFFALVAQGSGTVPTVDVDLVWHTHQLAPRRYAIFCNKFAGRFVNHDDSDTPGRSEQREELFARTKATYRAVFASEHRICLSWYCTASHLGPEDRAALRVLVRAEQQRRADGGLERMSLATCACIVDDAGANGGGAQPHAAPEELSCADAPPPCVEPPIAWKKDNASANCADAPPPCVEPPLAWKAECGAPPPCDTNPYVSMTQSHDESRLAGKGPGCFLKL